MPRNRIISNVQAIYVGGDGATTQRLVDGHEVLRQLSRVQSFNYNIEIEKQDISELGRRGLALSTMPYAPEVTFSLDYFATDGSNEMDIGLAANNLSAGNQLFWPYYFSIPMLSGVFDQERTQDKRNFYLVVNSNDEDVNAKYNFSLSGNPITAFTHPSSRNFQVVSFINSYLNNYKFKASIGDFPRVSLNYVADSINFYASGSGIGIPVIDPRQENPISSGRKFIIPKAWNSSEPSVIMPGNVFCNVYTIDYIYPTGVTFGSQATVYFSGQLANKTIQLQAATTSNPDAYISLIEKTGTNGSNSFTDPQTELKGIRATGSYRCAVFEPVRHFGIDCTNWAVQDVDLSVTIPREKRYFLGCKYPEDRLLQYPVTTNFNLSALITGYETGNLASTIFTDKDYYVSLQLKNASNRKVLQYDILGAKLQSFQCQNILNNNTIVALGFRLDSDFGFTSRDVYLSGSATYISGYDYILAENGDYLTAENGDRIISELYSFGPKVF